MSMNSQSLEIGSTQIRFLSTVKGLVSESEFVEKEIDSFEPDLIALGLSEGEIEGNGMVNPMICQDGMKFMG